MKREQIVKSHPTSNEKACIRQAFFMPQFYILFWVQMALQWRDIQSSTQDASEENQESESDHFCGWKLTFVSENLKKK